MRSVLLALALVLSAGVADAGPDRAIGDSVVFATVGEPGMPEGIAVRDGVVYVSTHTSVRGNSGGPPSRIFSYDLDDGSLLGSFEVQGQALDETHGVLMIAFDADGRLYAVDRNPPRIVRFDLTQDPPGQETYATLPDLPSCGPAGAEEPCSPTILDQAAFPDGMAFGPDGSAYVTDLEAATIFRVPPGGDAVGPTEIWYQDARFDGVFGLNGIAVDPTGSMLTFAMTGSQQPATPAQGVIYTLPLVDTPTADDLGVFHVFLEPAAGPDGIAYGGSGRLYVALAGHNQVAILEPDGTEVGRFPGLVDNQPGDTPYDVPASIAFDGQGSILVTNQSFFTANPDHWVVFDAWVDDTALPLIEPTLP